MWRFCLLLAAVFGWTAFAGCGGQSQPEPLSAEQESELRKQMEQTQDEERSHLAKEHPGNGAGTR